MSHLRTCSKHPGLRTTLSFAGRRTGGDLGRPVDGASLQARALPGPTTEGARGHGEEGHHDASRFATGRKAGGAGAARSGPSLVTLGPCRSLVTRARNGVRTSGLRIPNGTPPRGGPPSDDWRATASQEARAGCARGHGSHVRTVAQAADSRRASKWARNPTRCLMKASPPKEGGAPKGAGAPLLFRRTWACTSSHAPLGIRDPAKAGKPDAAGVWLHTARDGDHAHA